MPEQLTVERCIDIHDTSTATHVFLWRNGSATYLLRNVEVQNTGRIAADYGLMREDGVFTGWASELPDYGAYGVPRPGLFLPALGRLVPFKLWDRNRRRARQFEKDVLFAQRYGVVR